MIVGCLWVLSRGYGHANCHSVTAQIEIPGRLVSALFQKKTPTFSPQSRGPADGDSHDTISFSTPSRAQIQWYVVYMRRPKWPEPSLEMDEHSHLLTLVPLSRLDHDSLPEKSASSLCGMDIAILLIPRYQGQERILRYDISSCKFSRHSHTLCHN